jgi:hypothetical protein
MPRTPKFLRMRVEHVSARTVILEYEAGLTVSRREERQGDLLIIRAQATTPSRPPRKDPP